MTETTGRILRMCPSRIRSLQPKVVSATNEEGVQLNYLAISVFQVRATKPLGISNEILMQETYEDIVDGKFNDMGTLQFVVVSKETDMIYAIVVDFNQINLFLEDVNDTKITGVLLINKDGWNATSNECFNNLIESNGGPVTLSHYYDVIDNKVQIPKALHIEARNLD